MARITGTRGLLRLLVAYAAFAFTEHSTWVALMVYAFARGGAGEAGLVGFALLLPSMMSAPLGAAVAARAQPRRALAVLGGLLAAANAATAVAMVMGLGLETYVAGGVTAALITIPRPLANALLPSLATTPQDLVAANVATNVIEQVGRLVGPVAAALMMTFASPGLVFAVATVATLASAVAAAGLPDVAASATEGDESIAGELRGGIAVVLRSPALRWVLVVIALTALCNGIVDVLAVTFAEASLHMNESAAGWLMAGFGLGAVVGGTAGAGLVGGSKMTAYFAIAMLLVAATFAALTGIHALVLGIAAFAGNGAGQALLALISNVAIQRHAPPAHLTRVFGVAEGSQQLGLALGSLLFAQLATSLSLGVTLACLAGGVVVVAGLALVRLIPLRVLDGPPPAEVFDRIAADPLLAPLALPHRERLATLADAVAAPAGTTIIRQGDRGDDYFLIVAGRTRVSVDGTPVRELGAGDSFGEVALVLDAPRTATVEAITDTQLLRISRNELLQALSPADRHAASAAAMERYVM